MAATQMRMLVQTCTRELRYFIGPTEAVYVLAGNHREYIAWVIDRPGLKCSFIDGMNRLFGVRYPLVARVGSWESRDDINRIESRLFELAATCVECPPGQYVEFPEWMERQS